MRINAVVEEFASVVRRFVRLCNEAAHAKDAAEQLYRLLTDLLGLAWQLPDDCSGDGPVEYGIEVDETEYQHVYSSAGAIIEN